jgi:hypothetical protein
MKDYDWKVMQFYANFLLARYSFKNHKYLRRSQAQLRRWRANWLKNNEITKADMTQQDTE